MFHVHGIHCMINMSFWEMAEDDIWKGKTPSENLQKMIGQSFCGHSQKLLFVTAQHFPFMLRVALDMPHCSGSTGVHLINSE